MASSATTSRCRREAHTAAKTGEMRFSLGLPFSGATAKTRDRIAVRVQAWIKSWQEDELRMERNERSMHADRCMLLFVAGSSLVYLLVNTYWRENQPGLALAAAVPVLLSLPAAALARCRRSLYLRWREAAITAAMLLSNIHIRLLETHGQGTVLQSARGSSGLGLLGVLLPHGQPMWMAINAAYFRLPFRWNAVALPLLVALPLCYGRSLCYQFAGDASTHAALADLYSTMGTLHSVPFFPVLHTSLGAFVTDPLQQCLVVDYWLLLALGVALPLLLLRHLEHRERRRFAERQARAQQQGRLGAHEQAQAARQPRVSQVLNYPEQAPGFWWEACMASCSIWATACALMVAAEA